MKHRFLTALTSILVCAGAQCQVITKLHNGDSFFYYDMDGLNDIVINAESNDTIILPGGPINLSGSLVIDKPLVLIGAGVLNEGTPVTGITTMIGTNVGGFQETVTITSTGAGSFLTGIIFQAPVRFAGFGNDAPTFSAVFERCYFSSSFSLGVFASPVSPPAAANVTVRQCIITSGVSNGGSSAPQGLMIENCIIDGGLDLGSIATAQVTQSILLDMTTNSGANQGVNFTNNIFTRTISPFPLNSASTYSNNLFAMSGGTALNWTGAFDGGGNSGFQSTATNVFMNLISPTTYDAASDYHLSPGSPGLTMGSNGQVGIYGGSSPWKEDAIPFNPHWVNLQLGASSNGVINVNLSGAAQQD